MGKTPPSDTSQHDAVTLLLRALRLPSFVSHHEEVALKAEKGGWTFTQYLRHLCELEMDARRQRKEERLQRQSDLPGRVNMLIASLGVNDFLARIHPYRLDSNREFATQTISLTQGEFLKLPEGDPCAAFVGRVGLGDTKPLLDMPALSECAS